MKQSKTKIIYRLKAENMNQTEEKVILVFLNNICKNNAKKVCLTELL